MGVLYQAELAPSTHGTGNLRAEVDTGTVKFKKLACLKVQFCLYLTYKKIFRLKVSFFDLFLPLDHIGSTPEESTEMTRPRGRCICLESFMHAGE